jgi:tetratricopeptide (TPR) repeat protein
MARKKGSGKKKPGKRKRKGKEKEAGLPPLDIRAASRTMEAFMGAVARDLRGEQRPVDVAEEIVYEAWRAPNPEQAVLLAMKALEVSLDCADAYNLLAELVADSLEKAIELYQEGVRAGERALGKQIFEEEVGHFWMILETRPYMRARAGLAQCLWEAGRRAEAVEHCWDMLRLNPKDNQGIRDLLMPCLIELGRDEEAEKLFQQFKDDGMAIWKYSRALLDFRKHGDSPIAQQSLQVALEENEHVPAYLLGRRKLPRQLPGYYGPGDENEAVHYAFDNKGAWKATPGALEWLAAQVE